ncbi:MAG: caspase family protein [Myxococcales bacterium]|nr:caspase family protein [Myxococcales bacterium]
MLLALAALSLAAPPDVDSPLEGTQKARKDAAVVVSVEDYTFLPDLGGGTLDADALHGWLNTTRGVERITRLKDPDKAAMRRGISEAARSVRGGGMLWVYFAGHGYADDQGRRVLLSKEAAPDDPSGIVLDELLGSARSGRAKRILVILDADFGGIGRGGEPLGLPEGKLPAIATGADPRLAVWSAASAGEAPGPYPATGHGLFTWLTLGALRGWADGATGGKVNGEVSLEEAQSFVAAKSRLLGGRNWNPSRETRPDVMKWVVARGAQQPGPDQAAWSSLAQDEKTRRVREAGDRLMAQATGEWLEIVVVTGVSSPSGVEKLNAFIARYELAVVQVDGLDVGVNVPEVVDARTRLDGFARDTRKSKGKKRPKKGQKKKAVTAPAVAVRATPLCDDLVKLEPAAMGGTLNPDQITCLEVKLNKVTRQTERDNISRVLLANADGKASVSEWMRLAARHLDEVDRSDPDLCFRYALTLSREGTLDDAPEVLRWADYALENKSRWVGPTFVGRVYNLYRLRAETATRVWIDAEDELLSDRTEDNMLEAEDARGLAKNSAREWLDYALLASQPSERAYRLCETAAGSPNFCATRPGGDAP